MGVGKVMMRKERGKDLPGEKRMKQTRMKKMMG